MPEAHNNQKKIDIAAARRETVARLYLRGQSTSTIARRLNMTVRRVCEDIAACRELWKQSTLASFSERLDEQLAKLDQAEAAAWEGWERSLKDATEISTEKTKDDIKTRTTRKGQAGQATYIRTIASIIELRSRLLGLLDKNEAETVISQNNFAIVSVVVDSREEAERLQTITVGQLEKIAASEGANA
jgi:hypothetical protein